MNSWLWNGMIAAAVALPALSSMARAQTTDNNGCSNATLKGDYAFTVTDFSLQSFVVGLARFDGNGKFTQVDYPASGLTNTPPVTDFRTGETGTYSVQEDCTGMGELDFNVGGKGAGHGVHYLAFVISNGGRSIRAVSAGFEPWNRPDAEALRDAEEPYPLARRARQTGQSRRRLRGARGVHLGLRAAEIREG